MGKSLFFFIAVLIGGLAGCSDRPPSAARSFTVTFASEAPTGFSRELGAYRLPIVVKRYPVAPGTQAVAEVSLGAVRSIRALPPARWKKLSQWPPDPAALSETVTSLAPEWFTIDEVPGELVVTFHPERYDERRGEWQRLESAEVRLSLTGLSSMERQNESGPILLTGEKLRSAAEELKAIHREWGFESEIVTVEEISRLVPEPPSLKDLPRAGSVEGQGKYFKGYDAGLAHRTIAYLRDRVGSARPRAIVILGGAGIVPPSHYLYFKERRRWLPTDLCYAGAVECQPGVPLGRLPFSNLDDWRAYRAKLVKWNAYVAKGEPGLTSLAGAAFPGQIYIGEAAALHIIDRLPWTWGQFAADKRHRTRGRFDLVTAEEALSGRAERPYVLHFDHGEGNEIYFDSRSLSSRTLRAARATTSLPYVAMSMACANAAFDHGLVNEALMKRANDGAESIAEALLGAENGAIAYAGSIRRAMGDPDYAVDDRGNLSTSGGSYGVAMLMAFAEVLATPSERRLGDAHEEAIQQYRTALGNSRGDERHEWTWRNFVLMGDPLLPLPHGGRKRRSEWSAESTLRYRQRPPQIPTVDVTAGPLRYEMKLTAESWRELVRISPRELVAEKRVTFPSGEAKWQLPGAAFEDEDFSLVRWENPAFPFEERQVWLKTTR